MARPAAAAKASERGEAGRVRLWPACCLPDAASASCVLAAQERAAQSGQLREYGLALEQKLGRLKEDSYDLRTAKEDAAALRKQVGGRAGVQCMQAR